MCEECLIFRQMRTKQGGWHILCYLLVIHFCAAFHSHGVELPGDENWGTDFVPPPGVNGEVYATAMVGNDLYVGGLFNIAGTNECQCLARWDGSEWHDVGGGLDGIVYALT